MRILASPKQMQRLSEQTHKAGQSIGFVPTMGFLHEGHMSLVKTARKKVGPDGCVVVSLFVNPTQFGPKEDFKRYPRDWDRDVALCRERGVDVLFAPSADLMYPPNQHSTIVRETLLSQRMEGASRPTHFEGVTTVVAKLFHLVHPDYSIFGAKDYQQAKIIQRMTTDLFFNTRVIIAPTTREKDGLAMSSRNAYLTPKQREQAPLLWTLISWVRQWVRSHPATPVKEITQAMVPILENHSEARLDYIEFFHTETLEPQDYVAPGTHMALAIHFGKTRLIDNAKL